VSGWNVLGAVAGGLAGIGIWVAMIVITTGVCAVPILKTLWCTVPVIPAPTIPSSITLWDLFLLVVFIGIGAKVGSQA